MSRPRTIDGLDVTVWTPTEGGFYILLSIDNGAHRFVFGFSEARVIGEQLIKASDRAGEEWAVEMRKDGPQ